MTAALSTSAPTAAVLFVVLGSTAGWWPGRGPVTLNRGRPALPEWYASSRKLGRALARRKKRANNAPLLGHVVVDSVHEARQSEDKQKQHVSGPLLWFFCCLASFDHAMVGNETE